MLNSSGQWPIRIKHNRLFTIFAFHLARCRVPVWQNTKRVITYNSRVVRLKIRYKSEVYYYLPIVFFLIYYIVALLPEYTIGRKIKAIMILSSLLLMAISTVISLLKFFKRKPLDYRKLILIILPVLYLIIMYLRIFILQKDK